MKTYIRQLSLSASGRQSPVWFYIFLTFSPLARSTTRIWQSHFPPWWLLPTALGTSNEKASNEDDRDFIPVWSRFGFCLGSCFFGTGQWDFAEYMSKVTTLNWEYPQEMLITTEVCQSHFSSLWLPAVPQVKPQAGAQHHQVSEAHQVNVLVLHLSLYLCLSLYYICVCIYWLYHKFSPRQEPSIIKSVRLISKCTCLLWATQRFSSRAQMYVQLILLHKFSPLGRTDDWWSANKSCIPYYSALPFLTDRGGITFNT